MDINRNISMAEMTEEEREAFINSFPNERMRQVYEQLKAEGAYNPPPPRVNPMDEIKRLSAEIEKLKNALQSS